MQHKQILDWGVGHNVKTVQALCFLPCWRVAYIWQRLHMTPTFPWPPQWYVEMFDESLYTAAAPSEILALELQRKFPGKQKDEGEDRKKAALNQQNMHDSRLTASLSLIRLVYMTSCKKTPRDSYKTNRCWLPFCSSGNWKFRSATDAAPWCPLVTE